MERLQEKGIDTRPFFYPMNQLPMYKSSESFPAAEELSRKGINLPSSTRLSDDDIRIVCEALASLRGS